MPNYVRRKSFYKGQTVDGKKPYPYDPTPAERRYDLWKQQVINPGTDEYYTVKRADKEVGARHIVNQIIRVRTGEGEEFLYTLGTLIGYDHDGNTVQCNCAQPEMYEETI